jgi:hypothetical protein
MSFLGSLRKSNLFFKVQTLTPFVGCAEIEAKLSAAEWLREEREAEVYMYEDSEGFILGPYCMNELQAQLEKCALVLLH